VDGRRRHVLRFGAEAAAGYWPRRWPPRRGLSSSFHPVLPGARFQQRLITEARHRQGGKGRGCPAQNALCLRCGRRFPTSRTGNGVPIRQPGTLPATATRAVSTGRVGISAHRGTVDTLPRVQHNKARGASVRHGGGNHRPAGSSRGHALPASIARAAAKATMIVAPWRADSASRLIACRDDTPRNSRGGRIPFRRDLPSIDPGEGRAGLSIADDERWCRAAPRADHSLIALASWINGLSDRVCGHLVSLSP